MNEIRSCIFRYVAVLIAIATAVVVLATNVGAVRDYAASDEFAALLLGSMAASLLALLANVVARSRGMLRAAYAVTVLAFLMAMARVGATSTPHTATVAMVLALAILGVMAAAGSRAADLSAWGAPLAAALLLSIAASLVNVIVLGTGPLETGMQVLSVLIFSVYIAYDVDLFTKHCTHEYCCEDGVFNLWLDFGNVFLNLAEIAD